MTDLVQCAIRAGDASVDDLAEIQKLVRQAKKERKQ